MASLYVKVYLHFTPYWMTIKDKYSLIMDDNLEQKLDSIFQKYLGIHFQSSLNRSDVAKWDSLTHVKIILEIEKQFKIRLNPSEAVSIKTTDDLLNLLSAKNVSV